MNRGLEIMNEAMARGPMSTKGPRWTESQVMGALKGIEFMGKSNHLSFKHANTIWDKNGQLQYVGIKGADLMRELTGKFQGYAVGGLSGVDASNLAILAETSLQTSIDYARLPASERPSKEEFDKSQFVLQRFAKQVSDMRMGLMSNPEGASEDEIQRRAAESRQLAAALETESDFTQPREDVSIDMSTGQIYIPASKEKIRTGGAAITAPIWEKIAVYSDLAIAIFPNLKYMDSSEMSPVDKVIRDRFEEFKSKASTEQLTPEEIQKRRKEIAKQAVGIAKHSWTKKGDEEYVALDDPKKRRKANKAEQKRKKQQLKNIR
jgi:hypothetical protein